MGDRKRRRETFFLNHPICCFCGGHEPAREIDHIPSRSTFRQRLAPETFEFPACSGCNRGSSISEQVFALYVRLMDRFADEPSASEIADLMQAVGNNAPDCLPNHHLSANQKKRVGKQLNLVPSSGDTFASLPVIGIPKTADAHIKRVGRKLTLALHYREMRQILPPGSALLTAWAQRGLPNAESSMEALQGAMTSLVKGARTNVNIGDQFAYTWGRNPEEDLFGFTAQFSSGLMVLGATTSERFARESDVQLHWTIH